jgi:hypothetical protein
MKVEVSVVTKVAAVSGRPRLWVHREDEGVPDFGYSIRPCAPCPAVFVMKDDPHAVFDRQWQYFLRAANYGMSLNATAALMDDDRAYFNNTGLPDRRDWLTGQNLTARDPNADKVRTNARCVVTGIETFSVREMVAQTARLGKAILQRSVQSGEARADFKALANENMLSVFTFDSRQPPPLKAGRSYPAKVSDINPDDYLVMPRTHRWFFLVANIVARDGSVFPFGGGSLYPWTGDNAPYSFVPHIANLGYGNVVYPLYHFRELGLNEPIPSPYRYT